MQCNITAYIGRNHPLGTWTTPHVITTSAAALSEHGIYDATFAESIGIWNDEVENSIRLDLLNVNKESAAQALELIRAELNQQCIIYTVNGFGAFEVTEATDSEKAA